MKIKKIKEIINHNNPGLPLEEVQEVAKTIHDAQVLEILRIKTVIATEINKDFRGYLISMQASKNKIIKIQAYRHEQKLKSLLEVCKLISEVSPWEGDSCQNIEWCFFCGETKPNHLKDCSWQALKTIVEGNKKSISGKGCSEEDEIIP